jgi:hypothetical protein
MKLDERDIIKFQELYLNRFGIHLSKNEALEKGLGLVHLVQLTYKPMSKNAFQELQK